MYWPCCAHVVRVQNVVFAFIVGRENGVLNWDTVPVRVNTAGSDEILLHSSSIVELLLTHTDRWMTPSMGY